MRRAWIIPAGVVALFVLGGTSTDPEAHGVGPAYGGPVAAMGSLALGAGAASHDLSARVATLEAKRRAHVAAFPRGPYHLNIAGVQDFERKATR